jgi:hypothetical protein
MRVLQDLMSSTRISTHASVELDLKLFQAATIALVSEDLPQLPIPLFKVRAFVSDVGGDSDQVQHPAVEEGGGKTHGADDINEEDDPNIIRMVPGFVGIGVVKQHHFAFFPVADFAPNPDAALSWVGHL